MKLETLYRNVTDILKKAGADSPAFDAVWIINFVTGYSRRDIMMYGDNEISDADENTAYSLAKRRALGEPLQYIIGHWEFMGRKFFVGEGVLIPRDDTEVVVHSVLSHLDSVSRNHPPRIIDLCSGSGIIAITLKCMYPEAAVTAVEISPYALTYLEKNAKENNADIKIIHDDIFLCDKAFEDKGYDLIISNPPYINIKDMQELQKEVRFEPELALFGGEDGCDFYRSIIPAYTQKLCAGGMMAFEYDSDEADVIGGIMKDHGYENIRVFDDLGGIHRAINGTVQNK